MKKFSMNQSSGISPVFRNEEVYANAIDILQRIVNKPLAIYSGC